MKLGKIFLVILVLVLIIGPTVLSKSEEKEDKPSMDIITSIDISNDTYKYIEYKDSLIIYDGKVLQSINDDGKVNFEIKINSENSNLSKGKYIDLIDINNRVVYSINNKGNIIFSKKTFNEPLTYKSIAENLFAYHYKNEDEEFIDILNEEDQKVSSFKLNGQLIDFDVMDNSIIITSIDTEDKLKSVISKYDFNGNETNKIEIEDKILVGTEYIDNKLYSINSNKIYSLDKDLNEKKSLDLDNRIKSIETNDTNLYTIDEKNNLSIIDSRLDINIEDVKMENLKSISKVDDSILLYSDSEILSIDSKESIKLDFMIEDVMHIKDNIIIIVSTDKINLVSLN